MILGNYLLQIVVGRVQLLLGLVDLFFEVADLGFQHLHVKFLPFTGHLGRAAVLFEFILFGMATGRLLLVLGLRYGNRGLRQQFSTRKLDQLRCFIGHFADLSFLHYGIDAINILVLVVAIASELFLFKSLPFIDFLILDLLFSSEVRNRWRHRSTIEHVRNVQIEVRGIRVVFFKGIVEDVVHRENIIIYRWTEPTGRFEGMRGFVAKSDCREVTVLFE